MSKLHRPAVPTKSRNRFVDMVHGLRVHVSPHGRRDWVMRIDFAGMPLDVRLGTCREMSPIQACIRAAAARGQAHVALGRV